MQSQDSCNFFLKWVSITEKISVNPLIAYQNVETGVKNEKQPRHKLPVCHKLSRLTVYCISCAKRRKSQACQFTHTESTLIFNSNANFPVSNSQQYVSEKKNWNFRDISILTLPTCTVTLSSPQEQTVRTTASEERAVLSNQLVLSDNVLRELNAIQINLSLLLRTIALANHTTCFFSISSIIRVA